MRELRLVGLPGLPLIEAGDDLGALLIAAIERAELQPQAGDVLVVAQKIVSKAEGRRIDLATVEPSPEARMIAAEVEKDPRLVEVILGESKRVLRQRKDVLIVEHRLGFVMANAGVDRSNVGPGEEQALLLPEDPDRSAAEFHRRISAHFGAPLAVIVNDSFGRPWRYGTVGVALGAAGLPSVLDLRGRPDLFGRPLQVSETGFADEIAAAASLLMGQADEALPAVLVQGLAWDAPPSRAAVAIRPEAEDLFR